MVSSVNQIREKTKQGTILKRDPISDNESWSAETFRKKGHL